MRMIMSIFILMLTLESCQKSIPEKYRVALNYIKSDTLKSEYFKDVKKKDNEFDIFVADSIVFIGAYFLLDEFIEIKYGKIQDSTKFRETKLNEYLKEAEEAKNFQNYHLPELNKLNNKGENELVLYFSKRQKNILMAQLFPMPRDGFYSDINYLRQPNFDITYLFHFDEKGSLINAYAKQGQ